MSNYLTNLKLRSKDKKKKKKSTINVVVNYKQIKQIL